jgi:hypothetical protein
MGFRGSSDEFCTAMKRLVHPLPPTSKPRPLSHPKPPISNLTHSPVRQSHSQAALQPALEPTPISLVLATSSLSLCLRLTPTTAQHFTIPSEINGLRHLRLPVLLQEITPRIYMADSDFDAITNNGAICDIQVFTQTHSTNTQ